MEYTFLGNTKLKISKIVFGCWAIGGGLEWGEKLPDKIYEAAVKTAVKGGVNLFDTAAGYGSGHSEALIGSILSGEKSMMIASKNSAKNLLPHNGLNTLEESLKRLKRDFIDIYFLHWPHFEVPVETNMEVLLKLKEQGLIKHIGLSNVTAEHLTRALKIGQVDVIQPCFSLFWRSAQSELIPFCLENGIGVITYSSIAQGLLTGKFTTDYKFDEGDQRPDKVPLFKGKTYLKAIEAAGKIGIMGKKYEKTTSQTAINWVANYPGVTAAIVGAKTPEQVKENLPAVGWKMNKEDFARIGEIGMDVARDVMDWDSMYEKNDIRIKL